MEVNAPTPVATIIGIIFFLRISTCSYIGTANTTVAGPSSKLIISPPSLKISRGMSSILSITITSAIAINKGFSASIFVFL